jgi:diadenosine tetraphosphate (Ap4A) HIT family hydrolase
MGRTVEFERNLRDTLPSRTLCETGHFIVIASLGQITEGYLLILTKRHYPSMAHLPARYFPELEALQKQIRRALSDRYQPPVTFEHGPMPSHTISASPAEGGGACVDHAHFHMVPTDVEIHTPLKREYPCRQIKDYAELKEQADRNAPYFLVETREGDRLVFDAPNAPSQYLRRLLAAGLGVPQRWNWRSFPESDRVVSTVHSLRNILYQI